MRRADSTPSSTPAASGPMRLGGPTTPDRRLASLFTKRSLAEPAKATSVGIVSTFPPTQCEVAMFTASLTDALRAGTPSVSVGIVRVGADQRSDPDPRVYTVSGQATTESRAAARVLNKFDLAIIQHDYGIYDGADGDQVLDILAWLLIPVVLVVHTVFSEPTPRQRFVMESLTESADAVVAMSHSSRNRLIDVYGVEPRKIMLIPHGASAGDQAIRTAGQAPRPTVLTWGLLGPGKGIEWGIDALSAMSRDRLRARYVVAGQTHPKVLAAEGERYREFLARRAESRDVGDLVEFEPGSIGPRRLHELLGEADVVLLPFDSREQVTSGILTQAMASKVPVVATAFPHAAELLGDGRGGMLVPHKEPAAIAAALATILGSPALASAMSAHNATMTNLVSWPNVAGHYRQLFNALMRRPQAPTR